MNLFPTPEYLAGLWGGYPTINGVVFAKFPSSRVNPPRAPRRPGPMPGAIAAECAQAGPNCALDDTIRFARLPSVTDNIVDGLSSYASSTLIAGELCPHNPLANRARPEPARLTPHHRSSAGQPDLHLAFLTNRSACSSTAGATCCTLLVRTRNVTRCPQLFSAYCVIIAPADCHMGVCRVCGLQWTSHSR